jgi:hypothetical protein
VWRCARRKPRPLAESALNSENRPGDHTLAKAGKASVADMAALTLHADHVLLTGSRAMSRVPGMCRTQIGCAVTVPWCGWGEGWQALQVIDY